MNLPAPVLRYAKAGWRHRWLGLAVAWLICLVGWAAVYKLPSQYTVSTRVFAAPDLILGETLRGLAVEGNSAQQVETLQRTLLARPNLERVVARTGLDLRAGSQAEREAVVEALGRDVKIQLQTRQLFRIEYSDSDPRVAHDVVRTILALFLERAANNDRQQMDNARNFINQQIQAYENQLREAEQRRAEFRTRFLDLLPQGDSGLSRLEQSRTRLAGLRGELEDQNVRRELVRRQFEATPAVLAPDTFVGGGGGGGGGGRVSLAEGELRELRLRFTDQHPAVVAQRQIIAELRAMGAAAADGPRPATGNAAAPVRQPGPRANPQREMLQGRLLDAEAAIASLERQIRAETAEVARLEALARSVPQVQAQFANLDRDYAVLKRQYEELLERRESLQVAGAARAGADQVRLEVVEPPVVPVTPVGPNRPALAAGVLAVGLGAGAFLAIALSLLDRSFHSIRDLRAIGLPVLGAISALRQRRQLVPNLVFVGSAAALLVIFAGVVTRGEQLMARGGALLSRFLA